MSGRKLGGGRILGNGRGLVPAPTPTPMPTPHAPPAPNGNAGGRAVSPFAPSESTLSLGNSSSASGSLGDAVGDLMANVSLEVPSRTSAAGANKLLCPICEEEMVTLLQLNRHLDDAHQELPEIKQDEVKTWFDKQVLKAKRFQPLSILNQTIRGLEAFERNESASVSANVGAGTRSSVVIPTDEPDPEALITRAHWQRQTANDSCTDLVCAKRLGPLNGSINCRGCGKLFCEEHTMYQMKLSRAAKHDPIWGVWARVCETCFKSREGYNDHAGASTDRTSLFRELRGRTVDRLNLDTARLERRLTRLTQLLADAPSAVVAPANGSLLSPITGQKYPRKSLEQSVVAWEDDGTVARCPFCQQEFSWTFRRHHCRICGRVVCADLETRCSTEIGLHVAAPSGIGPIPTTEKLSHDRSPRPAQLAIDVRMCRDCNHTVFSKRDFAETILVRPPDQRAYETLRQFEDGIRQLMPGFQKALVALQAGSGQEYNGEDEDDVEFGRGGGGRAGAATLARIAPTQAQLQDATKIRKRLVDAFSKYGAAAKRLRDLKTDSATQKLLQENVYAAASTFLHSHMLPLKSVPAMLRKRNSGSRNRLVPPNHHQHHHHSSSTPSSVSPLRNGESMSASDPGGDDASQVSDASASTVLENEERELREKLVVLEEQRFLIGQMVKAAQGARRFEEVRALAKNAEELDGEIGRLNKMVGGVEERWEGLFREGGGAGRGFEAHGATAASSSLRL